MDYKEQVDTVIRLLNGKVLPREHPAFGAAIGWAGYQGEVDPQRKAALLTAIGAAFTITEQEIYATIAGRTLPKLNGSSHAPSLADAEAALEASLPPTGWLATYISYTRQCEAPLSYNIFCSLVLLGAALGRRVWRVKGHFNIYPNLCTILVGPPGRVKKSTAVGIARKLVIKADLCPILSNKITPEALVSEIRLNGPQQFVGAPELSVFLGKQRYAEGLIPLLLRILDTDDDPIKATTIGRGEEVLEGVTFNMIGGTTMSLLTGATADLVAGSGFLSRLVPVVENDTPRCFYNPPPPSEVLSNELCITLERLKQFGGEMYLTPEADKWLETWYNKRWHSMRAIEDEMLMQCMERGAIHLEKMAMLLSLADHNNLCISVECLETAKVLLDYAESRLPRIITAINTNVKSGDTEYVLEQIKRNGGAVDHSKLLRAVSSRGINADSFRRHIATLTEQRVVKAETRGTLRFYVLEHLPETGD